MSSEITSALIGGCGGAFITVAIQFVTTWLHDRTEQKRELVKLAAQLGMQQFDIAKDMTAKNGGRALLPPETWVCSSYMLLSALQDLDKKSPKEVVEDTSKRIAPLVEYLKKQTVTRNA